MCTEGPQQGIQAIKLTLESRINILKIHLLRLKTYPQIM